MRPSFFSLFKRGRYYRPASHLPGMGQRSSVGKNAMKEAERFAAAAIAFAWKHDKKFREHFFRTVCQFPGDPDLTADAEIQIEPERWADLLIVNRTSRGRIVHAVECKVGARLGNFQNPAHPDFSKPAGYGAMMLASDGGKKTSFRFVVLGCPSRLRIADCTANRSVLAQQRDWTHLATELPKTAICRDLVISLGKIGISAFPSSDLNAMNTNTSLKGLGEAIRTLDEVERRLDWHGGRHQKRGFAVEEGKWFLGVDLYSNKSFNSKRLAELVRPPRRWVAWFGYEGPESVVPTLSVWLYPKSANCQKNVAHRLSGRTQKWKIDECPKEGSYYAVAVTANTRETKCHLNWFCSVFEALGLKLKP